ncbi:paralemmin-3 [Hippocampus comes]|uniref:paralemmin-3 n=1 Tax=Hippocampus comes TaxID=109280 RepID=UPI00094F0DB5|nr:PREDICTED: paralemmin-1-like [Hippocampus comes]XP_019717919.1 PREDICTED: paralemmin-1-like [Hippocampus comes]
MDEAEKYQQRLEAIAEKRRLREEQERAKRDMEDEKLRLQQLMRKSLRDQWLMEGAPLSPSTLDSQSPHSPPWSSQEVGQHRLRSRNVGFAGEDEKEQITQDQTEDLDMDAGDMGTVEDHAMKAIQTLRDEDASVLMNGEGDLKSGLKQNCEDASEKPVITNGPSGSILVENHGQHDAPRSCMEMEEGIVAMRAERVVISDDEEVALQEHQEEGVTVEEVQVAPEALKELAKDESSVAIRAGSTHEETKDEDTEAETSASVLLQSRAQTKDEDTKTEASPPVLPQSPAGPLEAIQVTPVPVYSEPCCPPPEEAPQAQEEVKAMTPASEVLDMSTKAQGDALIPPPQFQEVSLSDPTENHRTEARPAEQEPLLEEAKAPEVQDDIATDNQSASTEMQAEAMPVPKKKTCQCCSVM